MVLRGTVQGTVQSSEVQVLSVEADYPLPSCLENLDNAPFFAEYGAGAALSDGTPLVCAQDGKCYKYLPGSDTWQKMLQSMIDARYGSGFAYNGELGLVMAGGYTEVCPPQDPTCNPNQPDYPLDSVERNDGNFFRPMTPLPESNPYNCLVSVNDET